MTLSQDAQNGRPARPQRVKGRGGTNRTSCGPFAPKWILANGKTPSALPTFENLFRYVEGLNDARTKLAAFFSILTTSRAKASRTDSSKVPNRHLDPYYSSRGECGGACLRIWATRGVA